MSETGFNGIEPITESTCARLLQQVKTSAEEGALNLTASVAALPVLIPHSVMVAVHKH